MPLRPIYCRALLFLLVALSPVAEPCFASSPSTAAGTVTVAAADAIDRLTAFAQQLEKTRREITPARGEAFLELYVNAERLSLSQPARIKEVRRALVACAGNGTEPLNPVAQKALAELERILLLDRGSTIERWLIGLLESVNPAVPESRGAIRALGPRRPSSAVYGIVRAARAPEPDLRLIAVKQLTGWSHAGVHTFFLSALKQEQPTFEQLTAHLNRISGKIDPQSQRALSATLFTLVSQPGWRDAARAMKLVSHLDAEAAVPLLIEALDLWVGREAEETGSRRIVHELVSHLRKISGRSIGAKPSSWALWWRRVREGTIALAADEQEAGVGLSRPAFFGLQPVSDRVLFVLDRSGSMKAPFAFGDVSSSAMRTRYEVAVEQVMSYLKSSGPATRFGLVLFSNDATRWKKKLVPAKPRTMDQARKWLTSKAPNGGTFLRAGIESAVGINRRGELNLKQLEADTIVVLCDGATQTGSAWVRDWVKQHNGEAQLVFHSVQIGSQGDGTLELLARSTGGEIVKVK